MTVKAVEYYVGFWFLYNEIPSDRQQALHFYAERFELKDSTMISSIFKVPKCVKVGCRLIFCLSCPLLVIESLPGLIK